jgi:K+-transporting ATPase c subunit
VNATEAAKVISAILQGASIAAPEPFGALMRVAAAAIATAGSALDNGVSEADVVKRIHRIRHISA